VFALVADALANVARRQLNDADDTTHRAPPDPLAFGLAASPPLLLLLPLPLSTAPPQSSVNTLHAATEASRMNALGASAIDHLLPFESDLPYPQTSFGVRDALGIRPTDAQLAASRAAPSRRSQKDLRAL
jgi:hypothetical protein